MPRLLLISAWVLLFCFSLFGQGKVNSACPAFSITGPTGIPRPGEPISFTAEIKTGGRQLALEYVWSVSHGTITKGEGTLAIEVTLPEPSGMTATLEIKGLPSNCPNIASETTILEYGPSATKLDEITGPIARIEPSRIERIRMAMIENPSSQLYVHVGTGSKGTAGTRRYDFENALAKTPIDVSQITFVEVDSVNEFLQIWLVPAGATLPTPTRPAPSPCPAVSIFEPLFMFPEQNYSFTAKVEPIVKPLTYRWTIDHGNIVRGQGTSVLVISADSRFSGELNVAVKIDGLPAECPNSASIKNTVVGNPGYQGPIDQYDDLSFADEKIRLDHFARKLTELPDTLGYLIQHYATGTSERKMAEKEQKINAYLGRRWGPLLNRISVIRGEPVEERNLTTIWVVPRGADYKPSY